LIDFPSQFPPADITVNITAAQPLIYESDLALKLTVKNNGPGAAEAMVVNMPILQFAEPVGCSADGYVICGLGVAFVPKLNSGESTSIEFRYDYGTVAPAAGRVGVFPLSADANVMNNFASFELPVVTGSQAQIFAEEPGLTYFRSDYLGSCKTQEPECSEIYTAAPTVTVTVPTPQWWHGNWWHFDSWVDGSRQNPRTFDGTNGISLFTGKMLFHPERAIGTKPSSLDFVALPGKAPQAVSIALYSTVPLSNLTVGKPVASWLTLTGPQPNPQDPGSMTVTGTANASGLRPGYYTTTFNATVIASGQPSSTVPISASLRILSEAPKISAGGIVNAASFQPGPISGSEILTIFGSGLGPDQPQGGRTPAAGELPTTLGGTRVLLNDQPLPLLYVQNNEISAIAISDIVGNEHLTMSIEMGGTRAISTTIDTAQFSPAFFTRGSSGSGVLAAVNADGSVNSPSHPAKRGSIVLLYGTGLSGSELVPIDACLRDLFSSNLLGLAGAPVEVDIGGKVADVLYAGTIPGEVCAVQQLDVAVPEDSDVGPAVPVTLRLLGFNAFVAQDNVTLAIE